MFVVIEGIDRCGKNVQAELLAERFRSLGEPVQVFTTPDYETETGKLASKMLLGKARLVSEEDATDEALALECVLEANRYEVAAEIKRCLVEGSHAVCVRWWPSSLVYAQEDGLNTSRLLGACSSLPAPDLYCHLSVSPELVSSRLDARNRYEGDSSKQSKMAEAYTKLWCHNREISGAADRRWVTVPGDLSPHKVSLWLWNAVRVARGEIP